MGHDGSVATLSWGTVQEYLWPRLTKLLGGIVVEIAAAHFAEAEHRGTKMVPEHILHDRMTLQHDAVPVAMSSGWGDVMQAYNVL